MSANFLVSKSKVFGIIFSYPLSILSIFQYHLNRTNIGYTYIYQYQAIFQIRSTLSETPLICFNCLYPIIFFILKKNVIVMILTKQVNLPKSSDIPSKKILQIYIYAGKRMRHVTWALNFLMHIRHINIIHACMREL